MKSLKQLFLSKNIIKSFTPLLLFLFFFISCDKKNKEDKSEVQIGSQIWMTRNLNVDKFNNGDPIPYAETKDEWVSAGINGKPAFCYFNNDTINAKNYGKLYNWYAVTDNRGLAPSGWKIPSDEDWKLLINSIGGEKDAGTKMKTTFGWEENGNGSNEIGFSAFAGGVRNDRNAEFMHFRKYGHWWSTTNYIYKTLPGQISEGNDGIICYTIASNRSYIQKDIYREGDGLSVRCVKK